MLDDGADTGFSMDLRKAIATDLNRDDTIRRVEDFGEMLELARTG